MGLDRVYDMDASLVRRMAYPELGKVTNLLGRLLSMFVDTQAALVDLREAIEDFNPEQTEWLRRLDTIEDEMSVPICKIADWTRAAENRPPATEEEREEAQRVVEVDGIRAQAEAARVAFDAGREDRKARRIAERAPHMAKYYAKIRAETDAHATE